MIVTCRWSLLKTIQIPSTLVHTTQSNFNDVHLRLMPWKCHQREYFSCWFWSRLAFCFCFQNDCQIQLEALDNYAVWTFHRQCWAFFKGTYHTRKRDYGCWLADETRISENCGQFKIEFLWITIRWIFRIKRICSSSWLKLIDDVL